MRPLNCGPVRLPARERQYCGEDAVHTRTSACRNDLMCAFDEVRARLKHEQGAEHTLVVKLPETCVREWGRERAREARGKVRQRQSRHSWSGDPAASPADVGRCKSTEGLCARALAIDPKRSKYSHPTFEQLADL
jgi:hypothetical protein